MRRVTLVPQPRRAVWSKAGQVCKWVTRKRTKRIMRASRQEKLSKTKNNARESNNHTKTCIDAMLLFFALHVVPEADDLVTVRVPVV
jgi:hypothetical protein